MKDETIALFDRLADRWDSLAIHPRNRIDRVLEVSGELSGLSVLDVGSGTGVLVEPLLERVGPDGKVLALDFSPRMIEVSQSRHEAANLEFLVADFRSWAAALKFDLVVAYSCYPHFLEPSAFWLAARRCLKPRGRVLIAHIEGRASINSMHREEGRAISRTLGPVTELSSLAASFGFETLCSEDDEDYYYFLAALGKNESADPSAVTR